MKKTKPLKTAHTANTQYGVGDFYGTGVKNKIGKPIRNYLAEGFVPSASSKPPKKLA